MKKLYIWLLIFLIIPLSGCDFFGTDDVHASLYSGIDTIEINTEWVDAGATITYGEAFKDMVPTGTVDESTIGLYKITYNITHDGLDYRIERYVMVIDGIAPVLSLNPGVDTVTLGEEWIDEGIIVVDNSEETLAYTTTGEEDNTTVGRYIITYTAVDSSGNESSIERIVNVVE